MCLFWFTLDHKAGFEKMVVNANILKCGTDKDCIHSNIAMT